MNIDKYISKLIEQFTLATGTKNIDINSVQFINDFNNWKARNNIIGENFLTLLEKSEIYFNKKECAEIGKGIFDSLVKPFETTIITPYSKDLEKRTGDGEVITSDFKVLSGKPIILDENEIVPETIIQPSNINTFMTFNPYSGFNINDWVELHYSKNYDGIIFGIFGRHEDKDKEEKLNTLIALRKLLEDNYIENDFITNTSYCYLLATDTIGKSRKLTRTGK